LDQLYSLKLELAGKSPSLHDPPPGSIVTPNSLSLEPVAVRAVLNHRYYIAHLFLAKASKQSWEGRFDYGGFELGESQSPKPLPAKADLRAVAAATREQPFVPPASVFAVNRGQLLQTLVSAHSRLVRFVDAIEGEVFGFRLKGNSCFL